MDICTPEPEKIPVEVYDFTFPNRMVSVAVWPTLGDEVKQFKDRYVFKFDRLHKEQEVYINHLYGVERTNEMRIYMTPTDILKKLEERRQREAETTNGQA